MHISIRKLGFEKMTEDELHNTDRRPAESAGYIRIESFDNHGVAASDALPDIWKFLDELCCEEPGRRLTPLADVSQVQKETLLNLALSDSKWVSEGKMDCNVQETIIQSGQIDDCITAGNDATRQRKTSLSANIAYQVRFAIDHTVVIAEFGDRMRKLFRQYLREGNSVGAAVELMLHRATCPSRRGTFPNRDAAKRRKPPWPLRQRSKP